MKYIQDHIPNSAKKRPGKPLKATTLTIHNTGNPKSTAQNERQWLTNPQNQNSVSWHIVVDSEVAIEAIPLNEVAYHAGPAANHSSIGIEICESGDFERTKQNAIKLIAHMLFERGWGITQLRKHKDWTGKDCPRLLIPQWPSFTSAIATELEHLKAVKAANR